MYAMTCDEIENLCSMYVALYPTKEISHLNRICAKMNKISFGGELLSSEFENYKRNSCISAFHNETVEHVLAYVQTVHWFKKHPEELYFGSSAHVVQNDFYQHTAFCYIPIQTLNARMWFGKTTIYPTSPNSENVTVEIPIPFKFKVASVVLPRHSEVWTPESWMTFFRFCTTSKSKV